MSDAEANAPLILTLALDGPAQGHFDRLRRAHFPLERNFLSAHLTLFHHLPLGGGRDRRGHCGDQPGPGPLALAVTGPILLGRGVAYALDAPELVALRGRLAERWWPWLGAQDRQRFRPM